MADEKPDIDSTKLGEVNASSDHFNATASIQEDGRVNIHIGDYALKIAKILNGRAASYIHGQSPLGQDLTANNKKYESNFQSILGKYAGVPRLNIAIHIVGSRGDVQPFIAIAKELMKPPYSHRVRICTHPVFKEFVEENGVEFFSIGGDPAALMSYMVRNPGLMPGIESLRAGDVGKRRNDIAEIIEGCWRSCIEPGDGLGKEPEGLSRQESTDRLFIADAIIANPPSYAHIHCAEKLGIPLHMMFTMPWSPTQHFPHPLASLDRNESDPHFANYISYSMMELLAWQGLGDVINGFRVRTLNLDPISPLWGHVLLSRMKVPFTYLWSPELIPKPPDWGSYINIAGFSFLNQATSYTPPADLMEFLDAGPPPVYIGFGSIVVDDPNALTSLIFSAVKRVGVRALVSKGWGGLGNTDVPEGVFMLGNVPHDWLFNYVSAVVHHGGAGTTAIGIAMGKPTVVCPFFGDQPFWGAMIYRAGAGPEPVPFKKMTEETLAHSITTALSPEVQTSVKLMSERIESENGAADAAKIFHQSINMDSMRCLMRPDHVAVWRVKNTNIRLGILAAAILLDAQVIQLPQLKLIRHRDWYVDEGAADPVTGFVAVASGTISSTVTTIATYSRGLSKSLSKPPPTPDDTSDSDEPPLAHSTSLDQVPTSHPVQKAAKFSPEHLEWVAYKMASKNLSMTANRAQAKRTYSWSPAKSRPNMLHQKHEKVEYHGRLHDAADETGHFAYAMGATALKIPVALFYNLANGFHNAPSHVLNDRTVRRRDNITGFGSGMKVAGKEVVYGIYDGLTGLVMHPYHGFVSPDVPVHPHDSQLHEADTFSPPHLYPIPSPNAGQRMVGLIKGVGVGVGGLVFKAGAVAFGIPGYTLKGLQKQLEKRYSRGLKAGLLVVRIRQGILAFERSTEAERKEVLERWEEIVGQGAG